MTASKDLSADRRGAEELQSCKKTKFKKSKKQFSVKLGSNLKGTPASDAGQWVCVVTVDGKEVRGGETTVSVK